MSAPELSRDDAAVFIFETWGAPDDAAAALVVRAEAKLRGFVYVRPHLRGWPTTRKRGATWQRKRNHRRAT